jgi:hypothetical protein
MRTILLSAMLLLIQPGQAAENPASTEPKFNKSGELIRPENYREWIFLTSGSGMTYAENPKPEEHPNFDNVFVRPESYQAFLATGKWPDKTIFILEIRASNSHGSINKGGHYQTDVVAIEAEVKDEKRFAESGPTSDLAVGISWQHPSRSFRRAIGVLHATPRMLQSRIPSFSSIRRF